MGERQVPALLRAKVSTSDNTSVKLSPGMKTGYMVLSEFEDELGNITSKVYSRESSAKASADGQQIIKVNVIRVFE